MVSNYIDDLFLLHAHFSCRPEAKHGSALIDHIYMDAMGFGMGCSCLQITFQSCNVPEARRLYDALVPIAPLMVGKSCW